MNFLRKKGIIVGAFVILILISIISLGFAYYFYNKEEPICENDDSVLVETCNKESDEKKTSFHVEVKGAVKKPGVYNVDDSNIINDVIALAGGFTKTAYTNNINLSKKVEDELVIYVFTKYEYKKNNAPTTTKTCSSNNYLIDNCTKAYSSTIVSGQVAESSNISSTNANDVVNINTADINALMTLDGIGEGKAKAIIEYRTQNGNFSKIEDIKNVSGIGDATYEKFKNRITV